MNYLSRVSHSDQVLEVGTLLRSKFQDAGPLTTTSESCLRAFARAVLGRLVRVPSSSSFSDLTCVSFLPGGLPALPHVKLPCHPCSIQSCGVSFPVCE